MLKFIDVEEENMKAYGSKMQTRMKILPQKIEFEVSEIKIFPKTEGGDVPNGFIAIKVDPPIDGKALEALLASKDLEVEDGRLLSFK
jgi:hypothetical protein